MKPYQDLTMLPIIVPHHDGLSLCHLMLSFSNYCFSWNPFSLRPSRTPHHRSLLSNSKFLFLKSSAFTLFDILTFLKSFIVMLKTALHACVQLQYLCYSELKELLLFPFAHKWLSFYEKYLSDSLQEFDSFWLLMQLFKHIFRWLKISCWYWRLSLDASVQLCYK